MKADDTAVTETDGMGKPLPDTGAPTPLPEALDAYYTQNGVSFGAGDLLCLGSASPTQRLSPLLSILLAMRRSETNAPAFTRVEVIAGPNATHASELLAAIDEEVTERRGRPLSEKERGSIRSRLVVTALGDTQTASVIAAIKAAAPQSAVIVECAARYRSNDVAPHVPAGSANPTLQEDFWAPQLHALTSAAIDAAKNVPCYLALDAGEDTPNRSALCDLLLSVEGCGVLGGSRDGDPLRVIATYVDDWITKLKAGRIGTVLAEVDALPKLGDENKRHVKIQMLHRAGLTGQAVEMLSTLVMDLDGVDPHGLVKLAEIAADGAAYALSVRLLGTAIDKLVNQEALQLALAVSHKTGDEALEACLAERLRRLFPDAPVIKERELQQMLAAQDFGAAAKLANQQCQPEEAAFYAALNAAFSASGVPDYFSLISAWAARGDEWGGRTRMACANDARTRGLPHHTLMVALDLARSGFRARASARILIDAIELALVTRGPNDQLAVSYGDAKAAINAIVAYLARAPADGHARIGIAQALSVETSGVIGHALLASALVDLADRPVAVLAEPPRGTARMAWLTEREAFLETAFSWLSAESPIVIGAATFPKALLTEDANEVLSAIADVVQESGNRDDDAEVIRRWATLGAAIAPHTSDPAQAIPLMRLAASKLATMGQRQQARDFAEAIMGMASTPGHARHAWFAMADIYLRAGNPVEAMVAMCCALSAGDSVEPEQVWHETMAIVRLLRNLRLMDKALTVLEQARPQFEKLGFLSANGHRIDLLEIQLRFLGIGGDSDEMRAHGEALLQRAIANALTVLEIGDDPSPIGVLLAQIIYATRAHQIVTPRQATEAHEALLARAPDSTATLMRTFIAPAPRASDVMKIVAATEPARYAEDAGFDTQNAVLAASRLLSAQEADDAVVATFAIELLSDRAVAAPGWEAAAAPPAPITFVEEPAEIARALARDGVNVALAGFDHDGTLVRTIVTSAGPQAIARDTQFSLERLEGWSAKHLPYRYHTDQDDPAFEANLFYTSTDGLTLGALPLAPIVVVADARLQQIPPNLFRDGDNFIGASRPVATAPSLSWLRSARSKPPIGAGARAWISTADHEGQTLAMVADRLTPILDLHGIALDTGPAIPDGLAGSRLAIVAAHGQVLPEGKFFQLVADDGDLSVSAGDFARALRNVGVVVLFVCSAGRADKHPASNTTVGLAKQLLDRGCSAVVASPWPLDSRVTYHWMAPFLEAWNGGANVIDCVFAANRVVDGVFPHDPSRSLALTLYGDPFMHANGF